MVTIYDTYPQMTSLAGAPFGLGAWRRYAEGIYPAHPGTESFREKIEADVRGYDFEAQIRLVLEAALAEPPELEAAHASFLQAAEGLAEKLAEMLPGMPDVDVVFYLGLCNGAGWATAFRGKRTVLIGVEKVLELSWGGAKDMEALLYHELGHIWHEARLGGWPEMQTQAERSLFQLYREGIAMRCEQLLCGDDAFYHQDRGDWLRWCRENHAAITAEFDRRMAAGENTQDFFGDWCAWRGHSDTGYYLGCEFVKHLMKRLPLSEAATLSIPEVAAAFSEYALKK